MFVREICPEALKERGVLDFDNTTEMSHCRTCSTFQECKCNGVFFRNRLVFVAQTTSNNTPFESRRVFVKFSLEFFLGTFIHSCAIHANLLPGNHTCLIRYIKTPTFPWLGSFSSRSVAVNVLPQPHSHILALLLFGSQFSLHFLSSQISSFPIFRCSVFTKQREGAARMTVNSKSVA